MPTTLGLHSPRLDSVRALKTKAGRDEQRRFIVEGPTMLAEALRSGIRPQAVYATEAGYDRLGELAGRIESEIFIVPERGLERLSDLETPPGVLAVVPQAAKGVAALLGTGEPLVLLAGLADPGNAGTLLRTAEIFGVGGVVFGRDGVEPYNPKVVRGSMGAIFRLPIAEVTPEELQQKARAAHYRLIATGREGQPLDDFAFKRRSIVAIGGERRGIAAWSQSWDTTVAIPQHGEGQSLNAAVAGGIILYAMMRQLDSGPATTRNR